MPSRRADGALVFKIIVYSPSISENIKVLNWVKKDREDVNIEQLSIGKSILQIVNLPTKEASNVLFQLISVTSRLLSTMYLIKFDNLLKNADAIIFIWDSLINQWEDNVFSLKELLKCYGDKLIPTKGFNFPDVPTILLASNRDQEDIVEISKIRQIFNTAKLNHTLIYETILDRGINIKRAFVYTARQAVLNHFKKLSRKLDRKPLSPEMDLIVKTLKETEENIISYLKDISGIYDKLKIEPELPTEIICDNCQNIIRVTEYMKIKNSLICEKCGYEIHL